MKFFFSFIAAVFIGLFVAFINKYEKKEGHDSRPILKIFGYSSFTGKWGPGPILKDMFEKNCQCKVEFMEGSDSGILLQRLKIEGESLGVDLVVGLDQFDLSKATGQLNWRDLSSQNLDVVDSVKDAMALKKFIPYDWGVLTFVARKDETPDSLQDLNELLNPEFSKKIALEDPRTSSPGFQFLYWVLKSQGEDAGFEYIKKMMAQAHSFSPSWSTAYGLFTKKQTSMVFSYITSPLYHQLEEKNESYLAITFKQPYPMQVEFVGIPEFCKNCELSEKFVNLMLSPEGQKILMEKNYMFPVLKGIREASPFGKITAVETLPFEVLSEKDIDRWLKNWTEIRRAERN